MSNVHSLPAARPQIAQQSCETGDNFNANRFAEKYQGQLIYVPQRGEWLSWSGHAWRNDEERHVNEYAKAVARDMLLNASRLYTESALVNNQTRSRELIEQAEAYVKANKGLQNLSKLKSMVEFAATDPRLAKSLTKLDNDDMLIGVRNGVIDLETGQHRDGQPADLINRQAGCAFAGGSAEVDCQVWQRFLSEVQPDPDVRHWLQKFAGYCLTGRTDEQVFAVFHGNGANGKSVFVETIKKLLGEYASTAQFETFCASNKNDAIRNDVARLDKIRLVVASEGQDGSRLDESLVKQFTGGDEVTARFLHREFFTFRPRFKVVLVTNHKPQISGTDGGIWRRVVLVPWSVTIPADQRDRRLADKLERELPGILAWALDGLAAYLRGGLELPRRLVVVNEDYRRDSDIIGLWLADNCDVSDPGYRSAMSDIYQNYINWASACGHRPVSRKTLGDKLDERGIREVRTKICRSRQGIRIQPPA